MKTRVLRLTALALAALAMSAPGARGQGSDARSKATAEAELLFNTGLSHLREGRLDNALDAFRRASKQDPKNPFFLKGIGVVEAQLAARCDKDVKCRQGHYDAAVSAARKALELNPYYVDARNDLGTWLLLAGKRAEGKKELLAAYEDPTNPAPEHSARNLGQAYFEEKNYAQAQVWFQTAVLRNRSYTDAYLSLADTLVAQNRLDEAIAGLQAALQSVPDDPTLLLGLGQACLKAGRLADARARLEQAASKDPGGPAGRRAAELLRTFPR
jgi:Flp pilus assembly protein TadD